MICIKHNNSLQPLSDSLMIGEIIMFTANTNPDGWLECNNQAVSRTTYANLFNYAVNNGLIGSNRSQYLFGIGDGSTTFNLPDLSECVIVGAGTSDRSILNTEGHSHCTHNLGEFKDDTLQYHYHTYTMYPDDHQQNQKSETTSRYNSNQWTSGISSSITSIGPVTRGKQVGLRYMIYYGKKL